MRAMVLAAGLGARLEPSVVPDDGVIGGMVGDASTLASTLERYPAGTTRVWN
jgi:hypothetical protein